jgi:peroxiredoxin
MRTLASLAVAAALTVSAAFAQENAPRKAPELTVVEPSGQKIVLSSMKGKVVVVTFVLTTCPHCQKESEMLTKLYKEMKPRGLEVIGVAVNDNAQFLVPQFMQEFKVGFPVGYGTFNDTNAFMEYSAMTRTMYPQVAVVDRKGMIRAASPFGGDANLQTESYMRNLLDTLLKEGAPASKSGKATASNRQN